MKVKSLEDMIQDLVKRVQISIKMSFKDFAGSGDYSTHKEKKVGVIVSFLAMLELVRQGLIDATQENDFDDIGLEAMNQKTEESLEIKEI